MVPVVVVAGCGDVGQAPCIIPCQRRGTQCGMSDTGWQSIIVVSIGDAGVGVVGPDQTTFTVPVPVVVADDLALGIGGGVVADQPAYIDANQVMKRGCRVGVIGNVKLAGITVPPLANGDAPVDRNRFCPVGHGIVGDATVWVGMRGKATGRVPGVAMDSASGIGGFDDLVELVVPVGRDSVSAGGCCHEATTLVPGVAVDLASSINSADEPSGLVVTERSFSGNRIPRTYWPSTGVIVGAEGDAAADSGLGETADRIPSVSGIHPGWIDHLNEARICVVAVAGERAGRISGARQTPSLVIRVLLFQPGGTRDSC